jgi:hypothetical protein
MMYYDGRQNGMLILEKIVSALTKTKNVGKLTVPVTTESTAQAPPRVKTIIDRQKRNGANAFGF